MKRILVLWFVWLIAWPCLQAAEKETVLAMCRPSVKQLRNIVELYERDLLPVKRLTLLGVYHENEETDYGPSREYIKENKLHWIELVPIRGRVAPADLFHENAWTEQFRAVFTRSDGIIFTGGEDLPPFLYGEENRLLTSAVTPNRSLYEVSFLFHLLGGPRNPAFTPFLAGRPQYPILAICLGCQTLNVACGGTLVQDIPSEVYGLHTAEQVLKQERDRIHSAVYQGMLHPNDDQLPPAFHRIRLLPDTVFTREMGFSPTAAPLVLTAHHQAVKELGRDLRPAAVSLDNKIVEALVHTRYANVLAVQFHPEPYTLFMKGFLCKSTPGGPLDLNLLALLEKNPPTLEFHRKIWAWLAARL